MIETGSPMTQKELYKKLTLSSLFNDTPIVIFIWENRPGWPVESVSPNIQTIYGYDPQDYIEGRLVYGEQIHPDDLPIVMQEVSEASTANVKSFSHQPYRYKKADGSYSWVSDATTIIRNEKGEITHYVGYLTDITAYIDTQSMLKEQEGRFKELFKIAPVGIALTTMNGEFLELNQALLEMTGYTHDEFLKLSYWDITPQDYKEQEEVQLKVLTESGKYGPYEKEYIHKDGHRFPVLLNGIITKDRFGTEYIWSIIQDISETKSAEQLLKKAQEITHIGHWKLDLYSNRLSWSDEVYKIFGLKPQEIESTYEAFVGFIHPDDREKVEKAYADSIEEKRPYSVEHRVIRPNGETRIVVEQCEHQYDTLNNIIASIGTVHDITERKQAELSLQESEERFALAMKGSNDGLWDWNFKNNTVYYSPRWFTMLGYDPEEFAPAVDTWGLLCHPDDLHETLHKVEAYREGKSESFEVEYRMRHKKGYYVPVLSRGHILRDPKTGEALRMVGTHVDLSSFKEMESNLKKAKEDAERANNAKSSFLANMSHEIRTPMNAILGFVDILAKGETDAKRQEQFNHIRESGNSLITIINDILDFSKIESGKLTIEHAPFALKDAIENVAFLFGESEQQKQIRFHYTIDEKLPKQVLGDSVRLKQVLSNLLSNAIKFTPEGGEVSFTVRYNEEDNTLFCSVKDSGIGIARKNLEKVFRPFEQEDSSTTREFGGTGLGLAISAKLVEMMGGKIEAKSNLGVGSHFFFSIPLTLDHKHKIVTPKSETKIVPDTFSGKVLIVEDNKTNQMLLTIYLDEFGLEYDIANDGVEALEAFKQTKYDLILMDENMPNMGGIETTQHIRDLEKSQQRNAIPIIAVTANALRGDKERFLEAGMDDYISKPYNDTDLKSVLSRYLKASS